MTTENWILFRAAGNEYMALPASVAMDVINNVRVVKREGYGDDSPWRASNNPVDMKMFTDDQMTVLQVKAKMVPESP